MSQWGLWTISALGVALAAAGCGKGDGGCDACVEIADTGDRTRRDAGADGGSSPDAAQPEVDGGDLPDLGPRDSGTHGEVTVGTRGHILIRGRAVLTMSASVSYAPGELYVEGNRIRCVGAMGACQAEAAGATVIETGGIVLPGLVDAHNHVAYDWLPIWNAGRIFDDSQAWRAAPDYDAFTQPYSDNKGDAAKFCAMVQWGEIRAMVHGTTTIYGTPQPRTCYRWLVRNAELSTGYNGFARDAVFSNTLGIDTVNMADAMSLVTRMQSGEISAYLIHLSEGFTQRSHDEFVSLKMLNLLQPQTVIIHGAALTAADFAEVAAAQAKLVWSPSSNLQLYNRTTDVRAAKMAGVSIALAPDWTPSGSGSLLGELGFTRELLDRTDPSLFTDEELVKMATSIPAQMLGVPNLLGHLVVGQYADVLVIDRPELDPYAGVVRANAGDIRMVMIDGAPVFGDKSLLELLPDAPPDISDFEACGGQKRAAWPPTPDGTVSVNSIGTVIAGFYAPMAYPLVPTCPVR
ncbi:MAG: amidohydrolase family protein [Myxococcota bacterium]